MKKIIFIALFGLSFITTHGQNYPMLSDNKDTIRISPTVKFTIGSDITVGTGSTNDGSFKYIRISSQSWLHYNSNSWGNSRIVNEANSLPMSFSGLKMHIKKFRIIGNEKRGHIIYLILGGGTATNYECDIVQAIKAGEVECNGCEPLTTHFLHASTENQLSIADELAKLKKLQNDSVLSEKEYQNQKEKLLSK